MGANFDVLQQLSDAQVIEETEASTNYFDMALAVSQHAVGSPLWLCIRVAIAPTGATSYAFGLENDGDPAFGSAVTFPLREAIVIASLTIGTWVYRGVIPYEASERYSRIKYTVVGTDTVGAFDAWVQRDPPKSDDDKQIWVSNVGNP